MPEDTFCYKKDVLLKVFFTVNNSDGKKLYNIGLLNDNKMKIVIQDIIN